MALKALGRYADSKASFLRAKELDPSDAAVVTALEEVSKMKATDFMPEVDGDEGDKVHTRTRGWAPHRYTPFPTHRAPVSGDDG